MTAPPARRGRRPGKANTRAAILTSARKLFGESGFSGASLRAVAADAGVDVRLVSHYFGTKADLFVAAVELPVDPPAVFDAVLADGADGVGLRLATVFLGVLETPEGRQTMTGLLRAAASEEQAAEMLRSRLVESVILPLARRISADRPELRAALLGSQIAGLILARYVVRLPPLVEADRQTLVRMIAPVIDHYLTGEVA